MEPRHAWIKRFKCKSISTEVLFGIFFFFRFHGSEFAKFLKLITRFVIVGTAFQRRKPCHPPFYFPRSRSIFPAFCIRLYRLNQFEHYYILYNIINVVTRLRRFLSLFLLPPSSSTSRAFKSKIKAVDNLIMFNAFNFSNLCSGAKWLSLFFSFFLFLFFVFKSGVLCSHPLRKLPSYVVC